MGPASIHAEGKKRELLEFGAGENDTRVSQWIGDYVASLDREIGSWKIREEREEW